MTKRTWTIRRARVSDAEALSGCIQAAYGVYADRLQGRPLPPLSVDYEEEIRSYPVWIAESEGVLVGGLVLVPEEGHLTLANIAVCPEFQGRGLGRGLIEFGEAQAGKQGYKELRLATHRLLTENLSLYSYLGWAETGRDSSRVFFRKLLTD